MAFPEDRLIVSTWPDPVIDRLGHDPRSPYAERYWLPILGPSCLLLVRRLAAELDAEPDGFELDTARWAAELGVGIRGGRNGPLWKAVERACRFGAAKRAGSRLATRRRLPPLTTRQIERLPAALQASHRQWAAHRLERPRRPIVGRWTGGSPDIPGPDTGTPIEHHRDTAGPHPDPDGPGDRDSSFTRR